MKLNKKHKILLSFFLLISFLFFSNLMDSYAIYRSTMNTKVYLSILDPNASYTIRLEKNDGSGSYTNEYRTYNQELGSLPSQTRANYNFLGWYDGQGDNANRIYSDYVVTSDVTIYAHWQKIVCKKVTNSENLHTETCSSGGGCRQSDINIPLNSSITYGTTYGPSSPIAGDAYNCDVNDDGIYDATTQYGKFTERFYFLRQINNGNDESTAALVYYTGFDGNGAYDSQHNNSIDSKDYNTAIGWLPTSSSGSDPWDNPSLIDFDDNNGKISRFLNFDDLSAVCGPISGQKDISYFASCGKWFLFENSRFQSGSLGRAGIWMQPANGSYYRIHTSSVIVAIPTTGVNSDNTARPVIEIPFSAFEGYKNTEKHTITFETHGGTPQIETRRVYTGEPIGTIGTVIKEHYTFDGWYSTYLNDQYSNPVNAETIVESNMTLHAKWIPVPTSTVTFDANGGTIDGENTFDLIVDTGDTIDENDIPEATYFGHSFDGWYYDDELTEPFDIDEPITDDITLYAGWVVGNPVARVNGIGYDTLAEAIAAVPTGKVKTTVTIIKNITLTEGVEIPNTKSVELDIGNYTITGSFSATGNMITNSGNLDIISGNMIFNSLTVATRVIANGSGATLNISGNCTLTNLGTNTGSNTVDHPVIENTGGTINITGGNLNSNGLSATINNKSGTTNISGGRVIGHNAKKAQAVYMEGGNVNISGDAYLENTSVSGTNDSRACVDNNGGTLRITGGTIVSKNHSAVIARKSGCNVIIGNDDGLIDINTPVMRGKVYGLDRTNGTVSVYDGIFESIDNTRAINGTVTKPNEIDFTDSTIDVDGVTYHSTYLLAPSITINFYEEDGGTAIPVVVDNGGTFGNDLPTPSPKQGYLFAGWFIDGDPLKPVTSETTVTGPFTVYAKWVQSVANATFDDTMSIQINTTDTIEFEEDDIEDVTYLSSDTNVVTIDSDGTVHAVGVGTATITMTGALSGDTETIDVTVTQIMRTVKFYDSDYDPNDLEHSTLLNTVQVVSGSTIGANMPATPTDTNYVFNAWYINGNTGTPFTNATTVDGDLNVVANWKEKVTYATLSTTPSPFEILVGDTGQITLTASVQGDAVEDYTFASNNTNYATVNSTTGEVTGAGIGDTNITVTGSLSGAIVQVPVSVDVLKYTVTFKDGNNVIKTVKVESGHTVGAEMPANQIKTNYIFNGWVFNNNNTLTPFTSATEVYGDIDVLVSWKEQINIATLPEDPLSVMVGADKTILVTATGEGNLVEDYTLSSSNTNILEVSGKIITGASVGSVTLTITGAESHLSETITVNVVNSYSVTFDPDNGDPSSVIQVEVGSSIDDSGEPLPTDQTKTDYVFDNWYLYDEVNETLTNTRLDTTATVTSDVIYKANWVSDTYKVAVYGSTTSYHETLQAAFTAVPTSGVATEVKILQDIVNPSGQSQIKDGRSVILNGGSHSVTCGDSTTNQMIFNSGGTLKIISGTYSCGKSTLATLENSAGRTLIIEGGLIENTKDRAAIFNNGIVEIKGGTLTSVATARGVVQNAGASARITMSGGTVNQLASSNMGALENNKSGSSITITGGTVTSVGNAINSVAGTTLTVGTQNGAYDATSPYIQGDKYGINTTVNYSIYDGIIKGKGETNKQQAVNDFTKITGTETGSERQTGTDGDYYTLYYELANQKYHIDFNANDGVVTPLYKEFDLNSPITSSDLPTPTRENHTFDGWYTDSGLQTPFATFTPTAASTTTYYAKWTYNNSSFTPVTHNILSNAMQEYFTNVSTWVATDATDPSNAAEPYFAPQTKTEYDNGHHLLKSSIAQVFSDNSCSFCAASSGSSTHANNDCNNPSTGTYCDYPGGYDTGLTDNLNVYYYENGEKSEEVVPYITSTGGKIYNMIPGKTYLWESATDNTKYGVITATGSRRTLKTSVRNLRDLGGLSASNSDASGTIDYGRLYRGAQITSAQGVTDLTKLGITREVDLRGNGDGNQTYKMSNYDTGTSSSYTDIVMTNYIVNPASTPYITAAHLTEYRAVKSAMRAIMEKVVFNHDSIFFHCTIGTDRTGTMAYFLEGLLGVSEEDRLRDYEMTYFFGLTNRTRFHDTSNWSNTAPRFYSMYRSYPTNADIYNYYTYESHVVDSNNPNDLTDDELLRRFRLELIH